jgi:RNA polymerase sigma-70 factor (ECF subfamily)
VLPRDDDAFRAWVAATYATSLRLARRIVAHDADAADVVQESYVRAYVALRGGRFHGDEASLAPWLRRIVTNAGLDALRARRRLREDDDDALATQDAGTPADGTVDRDALERAIRDLPDAQRTAFVLRELEGHSLEDTAERLGCTVGAVEQRVLRAWAGLKRRLHDGPR